MPISSAEIMKTIDEREMQKTTKEKLYESKHVAVECRCLKIWELLQRCIKKKKKERKTPGDIIILHLCTKNLNDIICSSWDIERDRLKLVILGTFLPFYPPTNAKNQNFKKIKKTNKQKRNAADIIILYMCTKNQNHMMYGSWEHEVRQTEFFVFLGHFLPFYPTNNLQN